MSLDCHASRSRIRAGATVRPSEPGYPTIAAGSPLTAPAPSAKGSAVPTSPGTSSTATSCSGSHTTMLAGNRSPATSTAMSPEPATTWAAVMTRPGATRNTVPSSASIPASWA